jgi:ABC-type transport system involved in multi-copper enzyme maturation permease subunit
MTNRMMRLRTRVWWAQIKAVIRLEMRKTFFAKRGLWIYLVALLPVLLFMAYAMANSHRQSQSASVARRGEKALAYQDLLAVKPDMTREEVVAILGKPPVNFHWREDRREDRAGNRNADANSTVAIVHEDYHYSDGQNDLFVGLADGKVERVNIREGVNAGQDSIMFAGVFQFFFLRLAIFFGCLGIFMNLFRGEILDRSLHFYFLAPIRREVLMTGKFLAGLLATARFL